MSSYGQRERGKYREIYGKAFSDTFVPLSCDGTKTNSKIPDLLQILVLSIMP
jgi:hypothetical protein